MKSLLREAKSDGRLTLRSTGKGERKVKTELSKKRRLPEAIEALSEWGLPEHEAVRQVGELLLTFDVTRICPEFDAFLYNHQMNHPKKGVDPKKLGKQQLNAKDPDSTVKAFHEAFERLLQAATVATVIQS